MRAVICDEAGGPEVLRVAEVPAPALKAGCVRLRVQAAGVNRADLLQRRGLYPPPPGVTEVLGLECSGVIVEAAPDVTGWAVGDRVMALLAGGAQAEEAVVDARCLLPVPHGLDPVQAAALPEALATVQSSVFDLGRLRRGATLLLHGGSGGIGTVAIQMARVAGARVVATAGSPERCRRCEDLGAQRAVCYRDEDFAQAVAEVSGGHGADVILDCIGAPYLERHLAVAASGARLVIIGLMGGRRAEIDLALLLRKRLHLAGSTLRARSAAEKGAILSRGRRRFLPAVTEGRIRPVVSRVLPLDEVAEAHRIMERSEHFGKIVLAVDPDLAAKG